MMNSRLSFNHLVGEREQRAKRPDPLAQVNSGSQPLWQCRYWRKPHPFHREEPPNYSLIVRTTLEVGRASPPPGPFTCFKSFSS